MAWSVLKSILFQVDAEKIHESSIAALKTAASLSPLLLTPLGARSPRSFERPVEAFGLRFHNPVGLAAGFDKNAELVKLLPYFGFGFVEIGTVTPRPQPGNPRPRLFRIPEDNTLFNCLGFNGKGAQAVSKNLESARKQIPKNFRVGVNIGKNKDTDLRDAHHDYFEAITVFKDLADYVVINVSSPNTEGLRSLQQEELLQQIIEKVQNVLNTWRPVPPLLIKFSPEFAQSELERLMGFLEKQEVNGVVLTNTLIGKFKGKTGGFSGGRLKEASRQSLKRIRSVSKLPIISVGGIDSVGEAHNRLYSGASLIQFYTGWVYNGPGFPAKIVNSLIKNGEAWR